MLNAQIEKGKVLIGVSSTLSLAGTGTGTDLMYLSYSSVKHKNDADGFEESDPNKMTNINLLPKVGYFAIDNLAVGFDLNIAYSTEKDGNDDKDSQTLFSVGPFVRYYIPTSKALVLFEINSSFGSISSKNEYGDHTYENNTSVMSFGGGIRLSIPFGEKVNFEALAGYNSLTVKDKEDNDNNDRSVIGSLGLKIGFTIFLNSN